ncbi:hypothetical protein [Streptomyces africanus]|uniref:hypothetical protein n=1 Tax=Streptomyces africanus TaxID=231024 RepID=UPI000A3A611D|nr:hypothetical protein [Streptomyces africanus]
MRRRVPSRRELLRRIEALEALHRQPTPRPLDGQEAIPEDLFGQHPPQHHEPHQLAFDDD